MLFREARANQWSKKPANRCRLRCFALPDCDYAPSEEAKGNGNSLVSLCVGAELRLPELATNGRHFCVAAPSMLVPETTIDKDGRAELGERDVRSARQCCSLHAKAKSKAVQR